MKDQNKAQMFTKQQFSLMWESLGVILRSKTNLNTLNENDEFDRASKEKIFINDLWDLINQCYSPKSGK